MKLKNMSKIFFFFFFFGRGFKKYGLFEVALQQKWAMVMKSSEDKQFRHQMLTFSEEKKNLSPNIIKILKLVTKSIFRHQRCTNW